MPAPSALRARTLVDWALSVRFNITSMPALGRDRALVEFAESRHRQYGGRTLDQFLAAALNSRIRPFAVTGHARRKAAGRLMVSDE